MQAKVQLWNRTGNGWPDVIFSEQVQDPVWMAQKPFDFAAPIKGAHPGEPAQPVAGAIDRPVHGQRGPVCVQDNIAPGGALGQQEADGRSSATQTPKTWQDWAALGQKVAKEHPGYIVGNIGDSFSHWVYFWGNQCPLQQTAGRAS